MGSVAHLVHESSCNLVYIPVSQRRSCNNAPEKGDFSSIDQVCGGETELGSFTGEVRFLLLLCTFLDYTYPFVYILAAADLRFRSFPCRPWLRGT